MKQPRVRGQLAPLSPIQFAIELGHTAMIVYWALRLMVNRKDTKPTYMYCWHLDRVTYFRTQFKAWLRQDPRRVELWKQRRLFVDDMPEPEKFKNYSQGSVGRAFYEMSKMHNTKGLLNLRDRRLAVLLEEKKGLDLEALEQLTNEEEIFERIVSRRNIFSTSSHDFTHMLTGSNTEIDGEALVAKYQYYHSLVPQNWLNMFNALLVHVVTLRWRRLREIVRRFPEIEQSMSLLDLDYETVWTRPLRDVRRELGLPEEGFAPTEKIEALLIGEVT